MFTIGKILTIALSPTALLVEALLVGLLFRATRAGRALVWAAAIGFGACLVFPVEQWAVRPLDDRFPQIVDPPAHVDGVIVLGGSIDDVLSQDRGTPIIANAANRLTAFVALSRRYPDAKLVFTGGSGDIKQGVSNEAKWARMALNELGLPPDRVIYEDRSRTTRENATDSYALVHPKPDEVWVLITSASHMPRSVGVFRKIGWNVLPFPVGYVSRERLSAWPLSLGGRLATLDWAAHEWIGLTAYRLRGWTDAWFPGPGNSASAASTRTE